MVRLGQIVFSLLLLPQVADTVLTLSQVLMVVQVVQVVALVREIHAQAVQHLHQARALQVALAMLAITSAQAVVEQVQSEQLLPDQVLTRQVVLVQHHLSLEAL
jgi:hypothetical protein